MIGNYFYMYIDQLSWNRTVQSTHNPVAALGFDPEVDRHVKKTVEEKN